MQGRQVSRAPQGSGCVGAPRASEALTLPASHHSAVNQVLRAARRQAAAGSGSRAPATAEAAGATRWGQAQCRAAGPRTARQLLCAPCTQSFVARPISHPLFKNISMADAATLLVKSDEPVGTCIMRPSSRSTRIICLTFKLPDDGVWHLDCIEQNKVLEEGIHDGACTTNGPLRASPLAATLPRRAHHAGRREPQAWQPADSGGGARGR